MKNLQKSELNKLYSEIKSEYDILKSKNYNLDMSRGKPSKEQLDLSNGLLTCLDENEYMYDQIDCRNYGNLDGLNQIKQMFSQILDINKDQILIGNNSSLNMMFDSISSNMAYGFNKNEPWAKQEKIKFLCPVPGYDRHFSICEHFGIEMIQIPLKNDGPDMDIVENYIKNDEKIKGIWCCPRFSNPDGVTYSDETVKRLASLKPAAQDFVIYWDDAYAIHHLYGKTSKILNILEQCKKMGNEDMVLIFTSFSKISFGGGGICCVASSQKNIENIKKIRSMQTIGPDKINQLRHIKFFKNYENILEHMNKHADILRPKFELVLEKLEDELGTLDIARWTKPMGGYFISFFSNIGCADKIVKYCKECGLILTNAGATYPYGKDSFNSNIRIAPSYPSIEELEIAVCIFCVCVKLATIEILIK